MPDPVTTTDATPMTNGTTTTPEGGSEPATPPTESTPDAAKGAGGQPTALAEALDATPSPAPAPAPEVPEKYEAWKVPEGYELDPKLTEEAAPLFKELGLSQDKAQKLVDLYAKIQKESTDTYWQMRQGWRDEMKKDPELSKFAGSNGTFGPDSQLVVTMNRALDGLQNPKLTADFKAAMNLTGAGDNPAFVKVFYALAKQVTEGTTYAQGNPVKADNRPRSAAAAVYPNLPSQNG